LFDAVPDVEVYAQEHPLRSERTRMVVPPGATVSQIVAGARLDPRYGVPVVILKRGFNAAPVPMDRWGCVRPKAGTQVLVHYEVRGMAIGALLSSLVSAAAPAIAGSVFGLTAGTLGFSLATAAITVIGGLLVSALIPPAPQPGTGTQDPAQFTITGSQNASDPYGIVAKPLGRMRMFPKRAARGYTVTTDEGEIEYRGRFVIGWGPMALSEIRIGTTPIENFSGIEIEFLNVDEDRTFANQPGIGGITKAWRQGTETMTLYPDDVAEDSYSILLAASVGHIRTTRDRTESADIDISFPQGLFSQNLSSPSKRETRTHNFVFRYRPASGGAWVSAGDMTVTSKQNSQFRRTHKITFPQPGEWDVEVVQNSGNNTDSHHSDKAYLSAIRSFRSGELPSHDGVAEIAIRVLASDQLNGTIDSLNVVTHQLVPIWNGSTWSAPQPSRHPAWILMDALRGPHLRNPVAAAGINLAAIKAWADEEPHWTCDMVVEQRTRVRDVVDIICAAGRAKFALTDLKYSVIRERPSEPIRQIFTPRNSWGFKGKVAFPREIHALRCLVRSERLDWAEDEVIVYADGYSAANATEFEELRLPGVVITSADNDQGNVFKLGRYHLAVAKLRPETFEFSADFEHLQIQRGDACKVVHDVPVVGIGAARVTAVTAVGATLTSLNIDDIFPAASGAYRISLRTQYGVIYTFTASAPTTPEDRVWTFVSGSVDATKIAVGDLLVIEETAQQSLEVLILGIQRGGNETALIRAVPRAPAVATAASGTIPDYDPVITPPKDEPQRGPALPVVSGTVSDQTTAVVDTDGRVRPRIAVYLEPLISVVAPGAMLELRWRPQNEQTWSASRPTPVGARSLFTGVLDQAVTYDVEVRTVGQFGRTRGWVAATATLADAPLTVPLVPVYAAADTSSGSDILNIVSGRQVTIRWENPVETPAGVAVFRPRETEVWRSADDTLTLDVDGEPTNAVRIDATGGSSLVDTTADFTTTYSYFLRAIGYNDQKSPFCPGREVTTGAAADVPLVRIYSAKPLVAYDAAGANPAPSTVAVSAEASGMVLPYFDFLVDGVSEQNGTSGSFAYTPRASDGDMPDIVRVDVREGATTGSVLASDRLTMDAYRAGSGSPIMQLTNESHDVPAASDGSSPDLTGAATSVLITIGGVGDTTNWTLSLDNSTGVSSTLSGTTVTVTAMTVDAGYVDITATRAGYSAITKRFSLSKTKAGAGGQTVAEISIFRRASSAPSTPSGGSYNFSTKSLSAPSSWSATVPEGSDPLYISRATVAITGTTGTVFVPSWTTPAKMAENGQDGKSIASLRVYRRAGSPPSSPTGGSYNVGSATLTPPSGWSAGWPSGSDPVYIAEATVQIVGSTGTVTPSWGAVVEAVRDGAPAKSTYTVDVYRRSFSSPSAPSGGSYNFGTEVLSPPSGWSESPPTGTLQLWSTRYRFSIEGDTGSDTAGTWETPVEMAKDGEDGLPAISTYDVRIYRAQRGRSVRSRRRILQFRHSGRYAANNLVCLATGRQRPALLLRGPQVDHRKHRIGDRVHSGLERSQAAGQGW
jgi:hypothetical protein